MCEDGLVSDGKLGGMRIGGYDESLSAAALAIAINGLMEKSGDSTGILRASSMNALRMSIGELMRLVLMHVNCLERGIRIGDDSSVSMGMGVNESGISPRDVKRMRELAEMIDSEFEKLLG